MRVIKLTESQFRRLFESDSAPSFDGGDVKEYGGNEVGTTTTVHDSDGNAKYGHMPDTDEFADDQTYQGYLNGYGTRINNSSLNY